MNNFKKIGITILVFLIVFGLTYYIYDKGIPGNWTRDSRIRANIIVVASQIDGNITHSYIHDNQFVHKGDLLFEIDRTDYEIALQNAKDKANVLSIEMKRLQNMVRRREQLAGFGLSKEEIDNAQLDYQKAKAEYAVAQQEIKKVNIDLARTKIISPTDGYITNLQTQQGNYIEKGTSLVSLVQKNSFYVYAYFQENKLNKITIGQLTKINLLNGKTLDGKVESFSMGIQDLSDRSKEGEIHNVDPTFEWIRLPVRIPVRIQINPNQQGYDQLIAGMSATVDIVTAE
ncbi:efflux RND transporter periplasmic adaptor subunit [Acinetobacter baumannii]|uniref:efflux RND transporter periplasmic adaptor subunit n=1 Tax=Acinetobacter calcoaceticus/baumannii complex TaxID=909768 RepID=UPI003A8994F1